MEISGGWDTEARLVDGRWIERRPRRPEVIDQLRTETRLLPWLAPRLPLPVPLPEVVREDPLVVRHEAVPGEPLVAPAARDGHALGRFLRALHACPMTDAIELGLPGAEDSTLLFSRELARFRTDVVPLLPTEHVPVALALLDKARDCPRDTLIHGDLGPDHLLTTGTGMTGVIDFGDAQCGDSARDLAWPLHGAPPDFAEAVTSAYDPTTDQRERALLWHRLGPWHEVTFGQDTEDRELIHSGLTGILDRLPAA